MSSAQSGPPRADTQAGTAIRVNRAPSPPTRHRAGDSAPGHGESGARRRSALRSVRPAGQAPRPSRCAPRVRGSRTSASPCAGAGDHPDSRCPGNPRRARPRSAGSGSPRAVQRARRASLVRSTRTWSDESSTGSEPRLPRAAWRERRDGTVARCVDRRPGGAAESVVWKANTPTGRTVTGEPADGVVGPGHAVEKRAPANPAGHARRRRSATPSPVWSAKRAAVNRRSAPSPPVPSQRHRAP